MHHLLGFGGDEGFRPVMAFRTIEVEKCNQHGLVFPGVAILQNSKALRHAECLKSLLSEWTGQRISYASSWTMAPELRKNRDMRHFLRDMMVTMLINNELDQKSDHRLLCGVPKVLTDKLFERLGYARVAEKGEPLPPFEQASLMGERAVLLHCTEFSAEALRIAAANREIWDRRRFLGVNSQISSFEKKAA